MSFERLIVCVDTSGSMAHNKKLTTAKSLLLEVVKSFQCETKYFKFTNAPSEISSYHFSNLSAAGGTKVEYSLKQLFSNHFRKWAYNGKNTKFIFVTDAEDRISDVAGCINAKGNCVNAYGNKLDCECVLIGQGGQCSAELKRIFGKYQFHHCSDANFHQVLAAICGAITKANTISNEVLPNIEREVENLCNSEQKENQQFGQDMQKIINGLQTAKNKIDDSKRTLDAARQNKRNLDRTTPGIISNADRAVTPGQMTAAEEAIERQTSAYRSQYTNASNAGQLLDEASKALETKGKEADKMAEKLSKKADRISKQASVIISNIIKTIKELTNITTGAYQQVKHLKAQFNKQLTDLMGVVSHEKSLVKELERVNDDIARSFKDVRSRGKELSDFKTEIASRINSLNSALQRLDERW